MPLLQQFLKQYYIFHPIVIQYYIMEKYIIKEKIGEGSYGTVVRVEKDGISYAIKRITGVNLFRKDEVESEIQIMTKLHHPNLIKIHDWAYEESDQTISIVMDYCQNGDFKDYALSHKKQFSTKEILDVVKQVVDAFTILNSYGVIHRDLKPENLLVGNNGQIKVADFGCARCLKNEEISKIQSLSFDKGTPCFAAPEFLRFEPYSSKCDVWSLGCIIYVMAYGRHPFLQKNVQDIIKVIVERTQNKQIDCPNEIHVGDEVKFLLTRCLEYKDGDRASWREFSLSRVFREKMTNVKDYLDHLKSLSNIANWISKTFWAARKKYKITENKDEIFIYFIIRFQYSILKLGEKILQRNIEYRYLFTENAWKSNNIDYASIEHYKTVYLKQTQEYFNLLKNKIKSANAVKVIAQKQTNNFYVFLDLDNSIRAAFRLLQQIHDEVRPQDDKVMSIIGRWINFEKHFEYEHKPSLQKILVQKIDNVSKIVKQEVQKSVLGKI